MPKDELISILLTETLLQFLLKNGFARKGEVNLYSKLLGITAQDLESYCNRCGYPGVDLPAHQIKTNWWRSRNGMAPGKWRLYSIESAIQAHGFFRTESKESLKTFGLKRTWKPGRKDSTSFGCFNGLDVNAFMSSILGYTDIPQA